MPRDDNCAPCIDNDVLSLALCKPKIRGSANVGDFLLGVVARPSSCFPKDEPGKKYRKELNLRFGDALYLARVTHALSDGEYSAWRQPSAVR